MLSTTVILTSHMQSKKQTRSRGLLTTEDTSTFPLMAIMQDNNNLFSETSTWNLNTEMTSYFLAIMALSSWAWSFHLFKSLPLLTSEGSHLESILRRHFNARQNFTYQHPKGTSSPPRCKYWSLKTSIISSNNACRKRYVEFLLGSIGPR